MTTSTRTHVAVVGAGPYGLSVAAHLRAGGMPVRVFGQVMSSWCDHMPAGMCLKSVPNASSLSTPRPGFTLADFCRSQGIAPLAGNDVIPIGLFVRYGQWFQEHWVPDIEHGPVRSIERDDGQFHLTLGSGEEVEARAVVIASGLTGFAYVPPELASAVPLGPSASGPVSHSSQHRDLTRFANQNVAVIGGGQSALEGAALLHEAGARVQVLVRGTGRFGPPPREPSGIAALLPQPHTPLGPSWGLYPFSYAAPAFRHLPLQTRLKLVKNVLGPLGAWWLRDRVVGQFPVLDGHRVLRAAQDGGSVVLAVGRPDGSTLEMKVDHVVAATGYRVEVGKLEFLGTGLLSQIRQTRGWPDVSASFESSVPGLFFVGLPAAAMFGPLMRFVCGSGLAARRVTAAAGRRAG